MLTRLLAIWIVLLAASPFTQPFSTVTPGWLFGDAVDNVALDAVPSNPPVELRPATQSHRDTLVTAPCGPAVHHVISNNPLGCHRLAEAVERERNQGCPFAVLRL